METQKTNFLLYGLKYFFRFVKWYLLFAIPICLSFCLYLVSKVNNYETITNGEAYSLIPFFAKYVLSHYPFSELLAKYIAKSLTSQTVTIHTFVDAILKGLITFSLVDLVKYFFNVRKDCVTKEKRPVRDRLVHVLKLIAVYGFWIVLCTFLADLVTGEGFDWIESNIPNDVIWQNAKIICIILFLILSILKFRFTTREGFLLCTLWVCSEKLVFTTLSCLCLTAFSMLGYHLCFETADGQWIDLIPLMVGYVLCAAIIDYLKQRTRQGIVHLLK